MAKLLMITNSLRRLLWILVLLLIFILITSCASQPVYEIYPTLSMTDRLEKSEKQGAKRITWWTDPCSSEDVHTFLDDGTKEFHWWTERLKSELCTVAMHEWSPSTSLLEKTLSEAAEEYGVQEADKNKIRTTISPKRPDLPLFKKVFYDKFKLEDDPLRNSATCHINRMLRYIDREHPNLLVEASRLKSPLGVDGYKLPSLVSIGYPVGVALTRWTAPSPEETKTGGTNIVIVGNTVVTPSGASLVLTPDGKPLPVIQGRAKDGTKEKDGKVQAERTKVKPTLPEDFKTKQRVPLSLSTVLNSPSVFDRIEYVSTYLYLDPFPFPPNGGVVLEKEFWRRFFALNKNRNSLIKNETKVNDGTELDMCRAIGDMRVRIVDTETSVKFRDLDFGSVSRKTSDKFSADIAATATVPPTFTSITPKVSYSGGVDTDTTTKLQQQLDQRSTYVDPENEFLRITQRGMQSVNLAGRFVENLTIQIPAAQDKIPVLVTVEDNKTKKAKYQVKWFSQPLYSRVDALTLSVVVARQATALAKSTKDSFRLDDPKDAAFIVGITQPQRVTLWQNEREMWEVMTREIFGDSKDVPENQKVFFTTFKEGPPSPLRLYDFTPEQQHELLRKIQDLAASEKCRYGVVSLTIDNNATIDIGLPDDLTKPNKLVGFKKQT